MFQSLLSEDVLAYDNNDEEAVDVKQRQKERLMCQLKEAMASKIVSVLWSAVISVALLLVLAVVVAVT